MMKINHLTLCFLILYLCSNIQCIHHRSPNYTAFLQNSNLDYVDTPDVNYAIGPCKQANCEACLSATKCKCPAGFAQDPDTVVTIDVKSCQYKQKHQALFFGFEFILFFGVGHFYAGRILYGIIKLLVFLLIIILDFVIKGYVLKQFSSKQKFNIAIYAFYFGLLAWQMIDLICIGINYFKDGKGIPLRTFKSH